MNSVNVAPKGVLRMHEPKYVTPQTAYQARSWMFPALREHEALYCASACFARPSRLRCQGAAQTDCWRATSIAESRMVRVLTPDLVVHFRIPVEIIAKNVFDCVVELFGLIVRVTSQRICDGHLRGTHMDPTCHAMQHMYNAFNQTC